MATAGTKNLPDETKISALLLHRKLLTEGQLKAAIDYQRSVGGRLLDTMVKLNLIRAQQVEELLNQLEKGDSAAEGGVESQGVLAPESVPIEDLKVHRRLLDKLPPELVERHLLVVFFPTAHLNQRRIILGHGRGVNPEVVERIRSVVGVELYTLELSPDAASKLLGEHGFPAPGRTKGEKPPRAQLPSAAALEPHEPHPAPSAAERQLPAERPAPVERAVPLPRTPPSAPVLPSPSPRVEPVPRGDGQPRTAGSAPHPDDGAPANRTEPEMLLALIHVLMKKGIIRREELDVEIELSRIRKKSAGQG